LDNRRWPKIDADAATDASPRPGRPADAVIIGAGVAGLAAAMRLGESGRWRATLLERGAVAGGLARCLHFKGAASDFGPHRINSEIPEVLDLIKRVAAPSLMTVRRKSHICVRGQFLPYPPSPLALARGLGVGRLASFGAGWLAEKLRPAPARETFESIMRRAFGGPLYEFLLRPFITKTWKTDPAQLHADAARARVSAGSISKLARSLLPGASKDNDSGALGEFLYPRGGAESLVRHLREEAEGLGARTLLGAEVIGLDLDEGLRVRRARLSDGSAVEGDAFLSTAPLTDLVARLLPPIPELADARDAAGGLEYLGMLVIVLLIRRPRLTGDTWLYFPDPDLIFNRAYEVKSWDPAMAPADRSALCLEVTLRRDDPRWGESDQDWTRLVAEQVARLGLARLDEIEDGAVERLSHAYPIYALDYADRLGRALEGLARIPNLVTLGRQGLFNHNNMDHSIYMGLEAAKLLVEGGVDGASRRWLRTIEKFRHFRIVD
jgi:protoporphyrinogen oxidase